MKRIGKILIGATLAATLIGGGVWYAKQRAAMNPEQRYKLATDRDGRRDADRLGQRHAQPGRPGQRRHPGVGHGQEALCRFQRQGGKRPAAARTGRCAGFRQRAPERGQRGQRAGNAGTGAGQRGAHEGAVRAGVRVEAGTRSGAPGAQGGAGASWHWRVPRPTRDHANLNYTVIRSPVDGVVVDRIVDLGQTVAASFQTPTLIKIAQDLSEMRIDTSFAEADIGIIREGQKARFTVDAFPNRSFTGEVQQIRLNPTNQQNVVTYNVRVESPIRISSCCRA